MIDEKYLRCHGAVEKRFKAGSYIFSHGTIQNHYYQVIDGLVKLSNTGYNTQDMTFQLLRSGEKISLYSLFVEMPLLQDAVALTDCRIIVMRKEDFNHMIGHNKILMLKILKKLWNDSFCLPPQNCYLIADNAENRVQRLFHSLKYNEADQELFSFEIKMSLEQIADAAGVTISNVKSVMQSLKDQGLIKILKGKIYF